MKLEKLKQSIFHRDIRLKTRILIYHLPSLVTPDLKIRTVISVAKQKALRGLRVIFDPRLLFGNHATQRASKSRAAALGLTTLANTVWEINAKVVHQAVYVCVLFIFTYTKPAWWPGRTRINKNEETIKNGVDGHLTKLEKA